jgi:hypothetical protein
MSGALVTYILLAVTGRAGGIADVLVARLNGRGRIGQLRMQKGRKEKQ